MLKAISLPRRSQVTLDVIILMILLPLSLVLAVEAALSLQWRLGHDAAVLHYSVFLIEDHGYALYRDVFEIGFPGTFLFHILVVKLFGYSSFGFMFFNLIWLTALLVTTWAIMKPFGWRVAWASVVFFGLFYFQMGRPMMLQRDCVLILPIALSILIASSRATRPELKALIIGLLFGLSAVIKPHAAIGWPMVLALITKRKTEDVDLRTGNQPIRGLPALIGLSVVGFLIPLSAALFWMWQAGSLLYFWEMLVKYLPLYSGMTGSHSPIYGQARWVYLVKNFLLFGGHAPWVLIALGGTLTALFMASLPQGSKRLLYLLVGLAVLYGIYAVFAGKFWPYHWMPFYYFTCLLGSLCLNDLRETFKPFYKRAIPVAFLVLTLLLVIRPTPYLLRQLRGEPPFVLEGQRVDEIAGFLKSHLKEGDRVQPLDWTGGSLHAMLLARAEVATQFIYDFHFYHHPSNPFIQTLRHRFIASLRRSQPRFIIEVQTLKPWVSGPDTTREFGELQLILEHDYSSVFEGDGYVIHERRSDRIVDVRPSKQS